MATAKVKSMSKADWQKLAKKYKVEFTPKNTVRYLVEKIAELNGVDDKIVDLDELKQKVFDKISKPKPKSKKKPSTKKKATTKKKAVEKKVVEKKAPAISPEEYAKLERQHYVNECTRLGVQYGSNQLASDLYQLLDYHCRTNTDAGKYVKFNANKEKEVTEVATSPTLESLKTECESLGLAYGSAHTVEDLTNLLSAFKSQVGSAGLPPVANETPQSTPTANTPELITDPSSNIQPNPTTVGMAELDIYHNSFLSTINNHFRLLTITEIHEMLNGADYPFTYEVCTNPVSSNAVCIILTSGECVKRVPQEGWIGING